MNAPRDWSAVQLALAAQAARDAQTPESEAGLLASEPIAIIGMGCRLPGGANDPEQFWTLLENEVDAVTRVPSRRWQPFTDANSGTDVDATPFAALLDDVTGFDANYFGIAPREAVRMDPQQRLLLEVTWDALRDAGCRVDTLRGSDTGVFIAIYNDDYARNLYREWDDIDAHTASGNSHGVSAGRISYLLDLHGPAVAIDTACSSSLVALHTACRSLRAGETSMAIVGAASLLIAPEQSISLSRWGMMAPDGKCKTFDASANGWVRGEGAVTLVVKRLADALGDGDRVLAVIRGTAINQDGRSAALTAPNGLAQRAVVRAALANARVSPSRVTYIEAHGTGTSVGDPIELEALVDEIGKVSGAPCLIGAVKANIGHLEAAAGLAGVLKVVQAMRHERIPPQLHFQSLNPLVSFEDTRLRIERHGAPWPGTNELRLAGVSSFGFGGTNAHVVIEEAPRVPPADALDDGPWLVTISAHDSASLQQYARDITSTTPGALRDVAWILAGADALRYRVSVTAQSHDELGDVLQQALSTSRAPADRAMQAAFVYSGHGSQWTGMARESLKTDAAFAASMAASDAIVHARAGWSVLAVLRSDDLHLRLDDTSVFQPVIVALQLAMTDSWRALGVQPAAVLGHSVGELTAACVAGALTRTEVLHIAIERGQLMQNLASEGAMLSVQGDDREIRAVIDAVGDVVIAGENAPGMFTISGTPTRIAQCQAALEQRGLVCHRVRVRRAFHSPQIAAAAAALRSTFAALEPRSANIPLYSSVTGARIEGQALDASYWERNARDMVRFGSATAALLQNHDCCIVEVSPHPVMLAAVAATANVSGETRVLAPTWRRARGERATMRQSAGTLWCAGVDVDRLATFDGPGNRVSLPGYRWQHVPLWAGAPLPLGRSDAVARASVSLPGRMTEVPSLNAVVFDAIVTATDPIVRDHRVCGRVVVPGTMILLAALEAAELSRSLTSTLGLDGPLSLRDVILDRALTINDDGARDVQIVLRRGDADGVTVSVASRATGSNTGWEHHASGTVVATAFVVSLESANVEAASGAHAASAHALYASLASSGIELGAPFRLVAAVSHVESIAFSTLAAPTQDNSDATVIARNAARLDAALHAIGALVIGSEREFETWMPVSYGEVIVSHPEAIASSVVVLRANASDDERVVDVSLRDIAGTTIGYVRGARVRRTSRVALARHVGAATSPPVMTMSWEAAPLPTGRLGNVNGLWLVFEDGGEAGTPMADVIESRGGQVTRVHRSAHLDAQTVDEQMQLLLKKNFQAGEPTLAGVVFAWGLNDAPASLQSGVIDSVVSVAGSAIALVRELAVRGISPRRGVLFVTRGAAGVIGDVEFGGIGSSSLWGVRNTAAVEHPELGLRILDLEVHPAVRQWQQVVDECAMADDAVRIAIRGNERLVARLRSTNRGERDSKDVALLPPSPPVLEALSPTPIVRRAPDAGMIEIAVEAAGLNFRDVLGALGMVSLPTGALGGECAGTVSAVGSGVTSVAVGDRVLAFTLGALRTHAEVTADLVAPMPQWMSFEHASTVPVAYMTAWHALVNVARLQRGERVLIHSAAGGVGLAAVHIAQWLNATVVGTAGSDQKRAYLESLGVGEVFDSRSVTFHNSLCDSTGSGVVDVVLNSLSDEFIPASIDVLRKGGRFVEIGKRGIWTADSVADRRSDVAYTVFDLADLPREVAGKRGNMLREITSMIGAGKLPVLPTTTYPLHESIDAFRFMAQARHTGKLAIVMPPRESALPIDGTYVVTGAFGALGRGVVEILVEKGARSLLLITRRTPHDIADRLFLSSLQERDVQVQVASLDVGDRDAVANALARARHELRPLRGVVHTAGVNDDGAIMAQSASRLGAVVRGKVQGAFLLDQLTRDDAIEFFVVFSSASGVLGWPGQSTYAAANTALDQIVSRRRASGRPAVSLQWGMWSGDGMAARVAVGAQRFGTSGIEAIEPNEALDLFM
ncbi:MAG: SDR family NAD(P)-dependent oxidoreductase, partial [Gemmatimonadaceae bacterium]